MTSDDFEDVAHDQVFAVLNDYLPAVQAIAELMAFLGANEIGFDVSVGGVIRPVKIELFG